MLSRKSFSRSSTGGGAYVPGGLWPASVLCHEIEKRLSSAAAYELIERRVPIQKSATSSPGNRPNPQQHCDSLGLNMRKPARFSPPKDRIIIVDDVVTRGSPFIGCHARVAEVNRDAEIAYFALIRTISGQEVGSMLDPVAGEITYLDNEPHRWP